ALLRDARDEVHRVLEQRDGLLEVDDVDLAARTEDVRGHLRVPVTGLVAEVDAGFQHLAHGDLGHCRTPGSGTAPRPVWAMCGRPGVAPRAWVPGLGLPGASVAEPVWQAPRHGHWRQVCIRRPGRSPVPCARRGRPPWRGQTE